MFKYRMLSLDEIKEFFINHQIPLSGVKSIGWKEVVNDLFLAAYAKSEVFAAFILNAVIDADRVCVETNFSSYEEVYDAFTQFLMGYTNSKDN